MCSYTSLNVYTSVIDMNPKVVKFKDGKFGLRCGNWLTGYRYVDLVSPHFGWKVTSIHFLNDCRGSEEDVERVLTQLLINKDPGKPV